MISKNVKIKIYNLKMNKKQSEAVEWANKRKA